VLLVGGGRIASSKLVGLLEAGARVTVVAPQVRAEIERTGVRIERREFAPSDLDGRWFVVAAATPAVNREVADAAEDRQIFVNAVDDPSAASAYLGGVVRKGSVTLAISTEGRAPALAGLLREALERVLPDDVADWVSFAERIRYGWRDAAVPMNERRPLLLHALVGLYGKRSDA
jgi:uroporphyrin-III C-methyltransferase/precorrin-2 dehydrogenase/sirohydrochlorin ferrochelatase